MHALHECVPVRFQSRVGGCMHYMSVFLLDYNPGWEGACIL